MFRIDILSHLKKSCSSVFPYIAVPIGTQASWPVFVTEDPARVILIQNQNQLGLLSMFIPAAEHDWMFVA